MANQIESLVAKISHTMFAAPTVPDKIVETLYNTLPSYNVVLTIGLRNWR